MHMSEGQVGNLIYMYVITRGRIERYLKEYGS